jgi:hypothetical protein
VAYEEANVPSLSPESLQSEAAHKLRSWQGAQYYGPPIRNSSGKVEMLIVLYNAMPVETPQVSYSGAKTTFQAPGVSCQPENDEDDLRRFDIGSIRNNNSNSSLNVFCPLQGARDPNTSFTVTDARISYGDFSADDAIACQVNMVDTFGGLSTTAFKFSCSSNPTEGCPGIVGSDRLNGTLRWSGPELFGGGTFTVPSVSWHFTCSLPDLDNTGASIIRRYSVTIRQASDG